MSDRRELPTLPEVGEKIVFALAIPHTPWRPERVASLAQLHDALGNRPAHYQLFADRAPNHVWSRALWNWGAEMANRGATHLVQLQDDVRPMPHFWTVLRAMVEANPDEVIALHANHPVARSLAHMGRRWFRTQAWVVGPQYVFPLRGPNSIREFLTWVDQNWNTLDKHPREHEDVLISTWLARTGRHAWHPIPAIADVDMSLPSTYEGADGHVTDHRRPCVTWEGYRVEQLVTAAYWQVPEQVETQPGPGAGPCVLCETRPVAFRSVNLLGICKQCVADAVRVSLNKYGG
jgi:hypothetical protein